MARIRKRTPDPHIVVVDTSTLWFNDKQHVVDPKFDEFWVAYSQAFGLVLKIPQMVKAELLYQHTSVAVKALDRANEAIAEVGRVTRKQYKHRVTSDRVQRELEQKFDQWVKARRADILNTPVEAIDWSDVERRAVWREPPFSPDKEEKGFRDALIQETIVHYCAAEERDYPIAFLCKDAGLRESVAHVLSRDPRFTAYEFISEITSYLDLTKQQLEERFIRAVVRRAAEKFFSRGDSTCLYYRDNIRSLLQDEYKRYFDNPEESEGPLSRLPGLLASRGYNRWEAKTQGTFWISPPQFVSADGKNEYLWESIVTFVRQYQGQVGLGDLIARTETQTERVLILPFHITWKAKIGADGRFWEYTYVGHELKGNVFREPTDEDRQEWNLSV